MLLQVGLICQMWSDILKSNTLTTHQPFVRHLLILKERWYPGFCELTHVKHHHHGAGLVCFTDTDHLLDLDIKKRLQSLFQKKGDLLKG